MLCLNDLADDLECAKQQVSDKQIDVGVIAHIHFASICIFGILRSVRARRSLSSQRLYAPVCKSGCVADMCESNVRASQ